MSKLIKISQSVGLQEAFEPTHFRVWCFQPCDISQNLPLDPYIQPWMPKERRSLHSSSWLNRKDGAFVSAYSGFMAGALGTELIL